MNSKRFLRKTFLSILLVTAILLGSFSSALTVYAVEASGDVLAELGAADTGLTVEKLVLSEDDVPEVIDFAEAQEKGHVLRLRSKESDDNTVVFLNEDNTETMYLFAEPVKYTDEYGNIKDKSTALTLSDGAYTMAQNDVKVSFASDIAKGVTVNKGDVNITMTPVSTTVNSGKLNADSNAVLATVSENKITYSNVFQGAELVYTTLYSGFKEDIVLESYDGINEFAFIVNTNGLYPVKQENGAVYFFEPNTDELVAKMMQVVCYDSAYNFAEGDVRITEVKANQIYGFTVVADSAFLADEDTVYPVYVDPTITLNTETAIEDTVVYSGKPTRNYGDYSYLNVGYVDDIYKMGYMMIRFPTLATDSTFASLVNSDINSATLTLYTASGGTGTEVLRLFTAASEWNESTVTYSTVPNTPAPVQFGQMTAPSGGGAPTNIVLTDTVKQWAQGATYTTPSKGIYILNNNTTDAAQCRDFLSVEYALSADSRSGYMPKLVIDYGTTTNTVNIVLEDDDDVDNGIVEVEKGANQSFIAKLYYNGNLISGGTLLTFQSLETSVADIPTATAASVRGISVGTAAIRATYSGQPRATADINVKVWQEQIVFSKSSYTLNNEDSEYSDRSRFCEIKAQRKRNTTKLAYHSGITYSIESVDLLDGNTQYNKSDVTSTSESWGMTVSSTGVLSYTIPNKNRLNTGLVSHPVGEIVIKATSAKASATVTVKVICDDISLDHIDPYESLRKDGRYIRIAYPEYINGADNADDAIYMGEYDDFDNMIESGWNTTDIEYLNCNFEESNGQYSDINGNCFFDYIATSKIAVIMTHGTNAGDLAVNAEENVVIDPDEVMNLHQGYFKNCELLLLFCCEGAEGASESLAYAFAERGVKRVIAFHDEVEIDTVKQFEKYFYDNYTSANNDATSLYIFYEEALRAGLYREDQTSQPTINDSSVLEHTAQDGTVLYRKEYVGYMLVLGSHINSTVF